MKIVFWEEFYELVWFKFMIKVVVDYGVMGMVLKKICDCYDILILECGYWVKLEYGKLVNKEVLLLLSELNLVMVRILGSFE